MGALCFVGELHAQHSGLELLWHAPQLCPQQAYVLAQVEAHLHVEPRSDPGWSAFGEVTRAGDGYRLELSIRTPAGELARRSLDAVRCVALADAAGVLIALAIERNSEADVPATAPAATADSAAAIGGQAVPVETSSGVQVRPTPQASSSAPEAVESDAAGASSGAGWEATLALELAAGLDLGIGVAPVAAALGLDVQLALRVGRVRVAGGLTRWFPAAAQSESHAGAYVRAQALVGRAALGFDVLAQGLHVWPAVVFEYGEQQLASERVSAPAQQRAPWAAVGAGAHAAWAAGAGFELGFDAYVLGALSRSRALLRTPQGDVALFATRPLSARFVLEIAYVFE